MKNLKEMLGTHKKTLLFLLIIVLFALVYAVVLQKREVSFGPIKIGPGNGTSQGVGSLDQPSNAVEGLGAGLKE
ncbi:hypothetical protein A7E78_06430 [Syntrophotalea acetylenivorans]|uniref:Uncharacterized protein n=1 Tax=Syntrophotalea acetylenivorans TaxID=1842532 RepID=A0A1L3GNP1_9BACT|nr:hypothetical protein [Syntrophotalea acetylenivorans]APG27510.1 hypothetical protein A7E78_06430 [Syntrophotalea acetylenivorans]